MTAHRIGAFVVLAWLVAASVGTAEAGSEGTLSVAIGSSSESGSAAVGASERYLAIYSPERSWRDPVVERLVAPHEDLPRFRLPVGRYRAVCSAAGYGMTFTPPVEVDADSASKLA